MVKAFVSSTCKDMENDREQLEECLRNAGIEPVLCEFGGVPMVQA